MLSLPCFMSQFFIVPFDFFLNLCTSCFFVCFVSIFYPVPFLDCFFLNLSYSQPFLSPSFSLKLYFSVQISLCSCPWILFPGSCPLKNFFFHSCFIFLRRSLLGPKCLSVLVIDSFLIPQFILQTHFFFSFLNRFIFRLNFVRLFMYDFIASIFYVSIFSPSVPFLIYPPYFFRSFRLKFCTLFPCSCFFSS